MDESELTKQLDSTLREHSDPDQSGSLNQSDDPQKSHDPQKSLDPQKSDDPPQIDRLQQSSEAQQGGSEGNAMDHSSVKTVETSLPSYCYTGIPDLVASASKDFQHPKDNFLRGAKWAPDGSCILSCSNDNKLRLFNLPQSILSSHESEEHFDATPEMEAVVTVEEGELVYDFQWFPNMSSLDAGTCCFVSVCRDHPIHLWDAYTGALRASYTSYNHLDEVTAPYSVAFHPHGSKMYCSFHNCIRIFDITQPGRQSETRSTFSKKTASLQGIVSCIAFNPVFPDMYALGSYSKSIGLYSESGGQLALFSGLAGGVTQLMFSPDGKYLFSGGRKDSDILCWDMRDPGNVLFCFSRTANTNQRMYFDLDRTGNYLVSGHQTGAVSVWDVAEAAGEESSGTGEGDASGNHGNMQQVAASVSFLAHQDCVNSISLHPTLPILATGSGQRKFPLPHLCVESGSEDNSENESGNEEDLSYENSLKLWVFQQSTANSTLTSDSMQCSNLELGDS